MFCTKCGNEIKDNSKFCIKCGNKLNNEKEITTSKGSITFVRKKQFYGMIVPVKIFIDGREVTSLSVEGTAEISLGLGKHSIAFDLWSGNGEYDIELTNEHPNKKLTFKLSMGAFSSKPKVISVEDI